MKKVLSAITILGLSIGLLGCGKNLSLSANTSEDEQIQFPEYMTFYEYLCSMDWMPGGKTDDL
ncbi:hypothetical protein [Butyrivibrio sp. JL13D10]|uniref:hypothetical protein n=1 Tax=Butyrivibrio sp. JL13D10 TaxID=3236815 RepID=UPI0038B4D633